MWAREKNHQDHPEVFEADAGSPGSQDWGLDWELMASEVVNRSAREQSEANAQYWGFLTCESY